MLASARRKGARMRVVSEPDKGLSPMMSKPRIANTGLAGALIAGRAAPAGGVCASAAPVLPSSARPRAAGRGRVLIRFARIVDTLGFVGSGFIGTGSPAG